MSTITVTFYPDPEVEALTRLVRKHSAAAALPLEHDCPECLRPTMAPRKCLYCHLKAIPVEPESKSKARELVEAIEEQLGHIHSHHILPRLKVALAAFRKEIA